MTIFEEKAGINAGEFNVNRVRPFILPYVIARDVEVEGLHECIIVDYVRTQYVKFAIMVVDGGSE